MNVPDLDSAACFETAHRPGRPPGEARIAVVIPAYRAEQDIAQVLRGIPEFVSWIVVVDDASPDRTAVTVAQLARADRRIHLVRHAENQGVGGAVLSGYRTAVALGAEVLVKMDGDGQMDPAYLRGLVRPILKGEADYVKGNRFVHARQLRAMPLLRRIGNLGLSFLTKAASGYWNLFDPTNGYTAMHASLVPLLDANGVARRYFFESSMLLELSLLRAAVRDVYVPARYGDETSHLSIVSALREFPAALLRGFLRRLWIQYFVRDFGTTSLYLVSGSVLALFGALFGSYHWLASARLGVATPTGTVMLAVLPVMLGVQFLLQAVGLDIRNQPTTPLHPELPGNPVPGTPPAELVEVTDAQWPQETNGPPVLIMTGRIQGESSCESC